MKPNTPPRFGSTGKKLQLEQGLQLMLGGATAATGSSSGNASNKPRRFPHRVAL